MTDRFSKTSPDISQVDTVSNTEEDIPEETAFSEEKDRYSNKNEQDSTPQKTVPFVPLADSLKKESVIPESNLGFVLAMTKRLLSILKNPTLLLIVSILCSFICLYIYFQVIAFVNMIAAYPSWAIWPLVGILCILLAFAFLSIAKLYFRLRKLRIVKQGRTGDIEALLKHKNLIETGEAYRLALKKENELYDMLLEYVRSFPSYQLPDKNETSEKFSQIPTWIDLSEKKLYVHRQD